MASMRWPIRVLLVSLTACAAEAPREQGEAPIPIADTHREIVVETSTLKGDAAFTMFGLREKDEKDDGSTGWKDLLEEQVEPAQDGFVRRRFRVTLANGSDRARQYEIEIDYVAVDDGELLRRRKLRKIFVPPFTQKRVSGYTPIRENRAVHTTLRVKEIDPTRDLAN